jgi:hypothetical protein
LDFQDYEHKDAFQTLKEREMSPSSLSRMIQVTKKVDKPLQSRLTNYFSKEEKKNNQDVTATVQL